MAKYKITVPLSEGERIMICDLCLNYGVQTVATTVQRKKVQVCFECMDKK